MTRYSGSIAREVFMFRGRPTMSKRQKEKGREEKRKQKEDRRTQRKEESGLRTTGDVGEDPDIAGIIPGPQAPPEDFVN